MSSSDLEEVLEFWRGIPGVGLNESDTTERLAQFLERNPGLSLIVREGDEATGRQGNEIIAAILCGHDGTRGYLHHLAVATGYQRRGIGKKLVQTCLSRLSDLGIVKCNIFVYADNDEGSEFWRSIGWKDRLDLKMMQTVIDAD